MVFFDQKVQILLIINKFKLKGFLYEQFGYIYGIYGDNRWGHVVHWNQLIERQHTGVWIGEARWFLSLKDSH